MKLIRRFAKLSFYGLLLAFICPVASIASYIVIDHTSVDAFSNLSDASSDAVQDNIRWHYAHTSHGGQITTGLRRIESSDARFNVAITGRSLPTEAGALNIFDGQEHDTYITPNEYWETGAGIQYTQDVLDHNPTINVSGWSWCTQVDSYSADRIQNYLDAMSALEAANPDVTFIYMTGNAQAEGSRGYQRYLNNEKIRDWVKQSDDRVLFDFADLDSWWYNPATGSWEQETYEYNGLFIPTEHDQFTGNESGHTTYTSTEQKGKAAWVMMAEIQETNLASPIPIPGALWLFGPGLLFLLGVRKRLRIRQ